MKLEGQKSNYIFKTGLQPIVGKGAWLTELIPNFSKLRLLELCALISEAFSPNLPMWSLEIYSEFRTAVPTPTVSFDGSKQVSK